MHHLRTISPDNLTKIAGDCLIPKGLCNQLNSIQIADRVVAHGKPKHLMAVLFQQRSFVLKDTIFSTRVLITIVT
jgi:hypothetical protein